MQQREPIHSKASRRQAMAALVAASLVCIPFSSQALAPVIAMLAKQMLQDMVTTTAKSMLLDSLSNLGCKGTAMANALTSLGGLKGGGLGLPRGMPAGVTGMAATPTGMPAMPGLPGQTGMPPLPTGTVGMAAMPGMTGMPPEIVAAMARMMPAGAIPVGLDAEQSAMLAKLQGGMNTPLSPLETIATLDEMTEIGMLPKAMNIELKECMLVLPQSTPAMGMAFGMLKPMLPQLREARDQMRALSPTEQDELAANLAQELDKVSSAERKTMLTELGGGMFPPRVVETLTRRYDSK
jgi:hypothetical protein